MLLTLNIKNESMKESFVNFLKTLDYVEIQQDSSSDNEQHHHQNKKNKFKEFAGMWSNREDITLHSIRDKAWQK